MSKGKAVKFFDEIVKISWLKHTRQLIKASYQSKIQKSSQKALPKTTEFKKH
jgi:hypothetical protein